MRQVAGGGDSARGNSAFFASAQKYAVLPVHSRQGKEIDEGASTSSCSSGTSSVPFAGADSGDQFVTNIVCSKLGFVKGFIDFEGLITFIAGHDYGVWWSVDSTPKGSSTAKDSSKDRILLGYSLDCHIHDSWVPRRFEHRGRPSFLDPATSALGEISRPLVKVAGSGFESQLTESRSDLEY